MTAKTPADKWKEAIFKYKKHCQSILKISENIRYAGVVNMYGRTLTGIVKADIKPLLKSEQVKNEFFIISALMSLRKDSGNTMGKLEHVILQHQKITVIILQKNSVIYYVSINKKEKDLEKIITLIKKSIFKLG